MPTAPSRSELLSSLPACWLTDCRVLGLLLVLTLPSLGQEPDLPTVRLDSDACATVAQGTGDPTIRLRQV